MHVFVSSSSSEVDAKFTKDVVHQALRPRFEEHRLLVEDPDRRRCTGVFVGTDAADANGRCTVS